MSDYDDWIGQQLDEYRLEELLGEGGMAAVFTARDLRLRRNVAIKIINPGVHDEPEYPSYVERFEREAMAMAQLDHPHIVSIYRYGEVEDLLYMAIQYVDGADLKIVLDSYREDRKYIEVKEVRRITREICRALDYAHSQGIIHRDVKPANVLLTKQGEAILTDFGLVLMTDVGTRGEIFGSPYYIAPEQAIKSDQAVPQSDLYAVGVMLYEMLTGDVPFDAENWSDVAMLHMTEAPPSPRSRRPSIPEELEAVILKALAKEPAARYATGEELADAVDAALYNWQQRK